MKPVYLLFLLGCASLLPARPNLDFEHDPPTPVKQGEAALIEVSCFSTAGRAYTTWVFFRQPGEARYTSRLMEYDGTVFKASIPTTDVNATRIEYYIAIRDTRGQLSTLPEENPGGNPYTLRILPRKSQETQQRFEMTIISPQPEEAVFNDEVLIAVSILGGEAEIDPDRSALILDGMDVSAEADISENLITYSPAVLPVGHHRIQMRLVGHDGELLRTEEWGFRTIQGERRYRRLTYSGGLSLDLRSQNLDSEKEQYTRGGAYTQGSYGEFDFFARLLLSSEESSASQPVNRYSAGITYRPGENSSISLQGGDLIPFFNPLVLQDKRVRGFEADLAFGFFSLDFIRGELHRAVEGSPASEENDNQWQTEGTYAERFVALRPGFHFSRNTALKLNFVNAKEDASSIQYGGNVKESLIVGGDLSADFDNRRIQFTGSLQASIKNNDASGPELEYSELVALDSSFANRPEIERAYDFLEKTHVLSITSGLSPYPSLAAQADLRLSYLHNNLTVTYLNINNEFATPGAPFLLKDIAGVYLLDHVRLFRNSVLVNIFFKNYHNNLSGEADETRNTEVGSTVSWYPYRDLPSFTIGYEYYRRQNDVSRQDAETLMLFPVNNKTGRLSLASSYDLNFKGSRNTFSVNYSLYNREDIAVPEAASSFYSLAAGVRSRLPFPLTWRLGYSVSRSEYGDLTPNISSIQHLNLRLDYRLDRIKNGGLLRPFVNLSLQNIDNEGTTLESGSLKRIYVSAGTSYLTTIGRFILRYDIVRYRGGEDDRSDSVLNARYELRF